MLPSRSSLLALLLSGLALASLPIRGIAAQATAEGFWTTMSDRDGKPEAVVEIREVHGEFVGTVRALLVPADRDDSICGKCGGDRRNQRIIGMEIVRHMRRNPDGSFSGGEVLDPENGKTYRATMHLTDGGQRLVLRGYIGLPMFGRSQTWVRRSSP